MMVCFHSFTDSSIVGIAFTASRLEIMVSWRQAGICVAYDIYVSPILLISCANVMTTTRHILHILNLPTYLYITGISSWTFMLSCICYTVLY